MVKSERSEETSRPRSRASGGSAAACAGQIRGETVRPGGHLLPPISTPGEFPGVNVRRMTLTGTDPAGHRRKCAC